MSEYERGFNAGMECGARELEIKLKIKIEARIGELENPEGIGSIHQKKRNSWKIAELKRVLEGVGDKPQTRHTFIRNNLGSLSLHVASKEKEPSQPENKECYCQECGWKGTEKQLKKGVDGEPHFCPNCESGYPWLVKKGSKRAE